MAADKYEPTRLRSQMNLQFGMLPVYSADMLLMASDGLWYVSTATTPVGSQDTAQQHVLNSTAPCLIYR